MWLPCRLSRCTPAALIPLATLAANTLARLRVCRDAGQAIPSDLVADAITCLEAVADAAVLRVKRDELIRRASLLMPPAPPHRLAEVLAAEAKAMARTWPILRARQPREPYQAPRDCLHAAALLAPLPSSQRQFYRVLRAGALSADMEGSSDVSKGGHTMGP